MSDPNKVIHSRNNGAKERPNMPTHTISCAKEPNIGRFSHEQLDAMSDIDKLATKDREVLLDIGDISGVVSNIKPSASIGYNDRLADMLSRLGLEQDNNLDRGIMSIAWTKESAQELTAAFQDVWNGTVDHDDGHRKVGKLLGYPGTSTEYFIQRMKSLRGPIDRQLPAIHPLELEGSTLGTFNQIINSPDNWREELDVYAVPLERATRELAPLSYKLLERLARRERVAGGIRKLLRKSPPSPYSSDEILIKRV